MVASYITSYVKLLDKKYVERSRHDAWLMIDHLKEAKIKETECQSERKTKIRNENKYY